MRSYLNPAVRRDDEFRGLWPDGDYHDVRAFFRSNPQLSPTPLKPLHALADTLGVASIYAKDETHRFGLNAFKIVGVSYAVDRLVNAGRHEDREPASPITRGVVCATAGNHGRAVARVAHQRRIPCTVFLPSMTTHDPIEARTRAARVSAMQADGATVVDVDGTYEEAVRQAAAFGAADRRHDRLGHVVGGLRTDPALDHGGLHADLRRGRRASGTHRPTLVIVQGWRRRAGLRGRQLVRLAVRRRPSVLRRGEPEQRRVPADVGARGAPADDRFGLSTRSWRACAAPSPHPPRGRRSPPASMRSSPCRTRGAATRWTTDARWP